MKSIHCSRTIDAELGRVFQVVSDVRNFRQAVPHIIRIEFTTERQAGIGTRFRETRVMHGREHTVELEVAEYVENETVRMIADAGGTRWDTHFTVSQVANGTKLDLRMDISPQTWIARVFNPLIRGMVVRGVESDLASVKDFCESDRQIDDVLPASGS